MGQEIWVLYSLMLGWLSLHLLLYTSRLHLQVAPERLLKLGRKSWASKQVLDPVLEVGCCHLMEWSTTTGLTSNGL